jgi:hypothetical protein|tara:strand:+ start:64 stop:279 length:216 start_codon:yes stop_codon:yes gene_type:complete
MIENVNEATETTEDDVAEIETVDVEAEIDTPAPHIPWKQHKTEAPDTNKHRWKQHKAEAPTRTLVEKLLGK